MDSLLVLTVNELKTTILVFVFFQSKYISVILNKMYDHYMPLPSDCLWTRFFTGERAFRYKVPSRMMDNGNDLRTLLPTHDDLNTTRSCRNQSKETILIGNRQLNAENVKLYSVQTVWRVPRPKYFLKGNLIWYDVSPFWCLKLIFKQRRLYE